MMTAQVDPTGKSLQPWASTGEASAPAQSKIDQGWQEEIPSSGNWNGIIFKANIAHTNITPIDISGNGLVSKFENDKT